MEEQFSTVEEISDEVKILCRLEGVMEFDDEGVVDHLHYVSLDLCVIYLISSDDEIFL